MGMKTDERLRNPGRAVEWRGEVPARDRRDRPPRTIREVVESLEDRRAFLASLRKQLRRKPR